MEIHGKVWGTTATLFAKNNVELHRITGLPGRHCSKHHHVSKFNRFYVESGCLSIKVWKSYGLVDETILTAGMSCTVRPGEVHQFEVIDADTVAFEIYWTELEPDDIVREGSGG